LLCLQAKNPGKEAMMSASLHFIDSDAHVIEPSDMFERYLEPKYRSQIPVAWADYQGEPLAFGFEIRIPKASGGEHVMPFGGDPLTGKNRIDGHSGLAAFDGGSRVALPGHDEAYAEFARRGFPPEMYALAMDRSGIDYMVVYPSAGLLTTAVPDLPADTAAAYRRAYNNWLPDFCVVAGKRVVGAAAVDLRDAGEAARKALRCVKETELSLWSLTSSRRQGLVCQTTERWTGIVGATRRRADGFRNLYSDCE
jgi:uncharacterized protein